MQCGNYPDGLMDTTTPVHGAIDQKTQRAGWTIGQKADRVFETGVYDLTPVLVHFGEDRTPPWLLVRMRQPNSSKSAAVRGGKSPTSTHPQSGRETSQESLTAIRR